MISWESNPKEWLSSDEILEVMKQYEHSHPEFVFLGPSPIDFEKKTILSPLIVDRISQEDLYCRETSWVNRESGFPI